MHKRVNIGELWALHADALARTAGKRKACNDAKRAEDALVSDAVGALQTKACAPKPPASLVVVAGGGSADVSGAAPAAGSDAVPENSQILVRSN